MTTIPDNIKVEVSQLDIDLGEPGESSACAISLALEAAFKNDRLIFQVEPESVEIYEVVGDGSFARLKTFHLPPAAQVFVNRFDRQIAVEPITFDLTFEPSYATES